MRPAIWITVEQGPTVLVVGAGGGYLDIFTLIYPFPSSFPFFGRRPDIVIWLVVLGLTAL